LRTTIGRESDSVSRVSRKANQLPTDVAALHALVAALCTERDAAIAERDAAIVERDQAVSQNHRLQHLLQQLRRMQFGRRSEKLDADQLALAFEDIEQAIAARRRARTSATRRPRASALRSAASIVERFPPICRACM
jgi:transposase